MILYGRNLSPFTRRVALWCAMQGRQIERRELGVVGADFEEVAKHNPVARVPILELEDGTRLIESFAICDYLDETAPEGRRLIPASGPARREAMQRLAMAHSTAEKAVAMVYEKIRRPEAFHWPDWQTRLSGQITGGLAEADAMAKGRGAAPDGGDLALVVLHQFAEAAVPWLLEPGYPDLAALSRVGMDWPGVSETMPKA